MVADRSDDGLTITWTYWLAVIGCGLILLTLLIHQSRNPVILGRYTIKYSAMLILVIAGYASGLVFGSYRQPWGSWLIARSARLPADALVTGQVLILAAFGWLLLYGTQHYAFFSNLLLWTGVVLLGVAGGRLAYRISIVQSSQQRSASKQTAAGPSLAPPTLIQFAEKWSPFAIIALGFWLRLIALDTLPTFVDEGIHLAWARLYAANNNNFGWLADGRPLLIVTLAQLRMIGPGALWLGRRAQCGR